MSVVTKDILKTYFETGDYPTQAQFANLIDSLRSEEDPIALTDLSEEVITAINDAGGSGNPPIVTAPGANSVIIPNGVLIDLIVVFYGDGINFSAGWTTGGIDVVDNYTVIGSVCPISTAVYNIETRTLHLNGVGVDTIIKLYKR